MTSILYTALAFSDVFTSSVRFSGCGDERAEYNLQYADAKRDFKADISGWLTEEQMSDDRFVQDVAQFVIDHMEKDTSPSVVACFKGWRLSN